MRSKLTTALLAAEIRWPRTYKMLRRLMYDTETIARHLKASVARMWANLTTSESATAYEARYQASAAKIASDLINKAQSDEGFPIGG